MSSNVIHFNILLVDVEGYIYPITCDVCERSDLVLVCPVVSTWTRNNATVCSDPRTCVISGVSSDDFGVYLCGGNVYSVHVLIREGKTPVLYESCCNPRIDALKKWKVCLTTLQ